MNFKKQMELLSEVYLKGVDDSFNIIKKSLHEMEEILKEAHKEGLNIVIQRERNKCEH